jgi:hypothetical protein
MGLHTSTLSCGSVFITSLEKVGNIFKDSLELSWWFSIFLKHLNYHQLLHKIPVEPLVFIILQYKDGQSSASISWWTGFDYFSI